MTPMAVAPQPRAAEAAVEVLRNGGNAVDAAITAAFVQGIVDPLNCGMGGLGWMHIYDAASGEDLILDFCSRAGSKATPDMWEGLIERQGEDGLGYILRGDVNEIGYQSIGLPTAIRGLHEALTRYGTLDWGSVIAPAARLAREGYVVPRELAEEWRTRYSPGRPDAMTRFSVTPDAAAIYTRDGAPLDNGDVLTNPDYAASLERIADAGPDDYYTGDIADRLLADWEANGGHVTADDLADFQPEVQAPVRGTYRGYTISDMQPPSGGVTLVQVLNILEGYDLTSMGHNSAEYIRVLALALGAGFEDRGRYVGDPAFVDVPVDMLTSKEYAAEWGRRIDRGDGPAAGRARSTDGAGTTHISVVDRDGGCVSLTHTNGLCSGVITPGLGFLQNNYMISFDPKPGGPELHRAGQEAHDRRVALHRLQGRQALHGRGRAGRDLHHRRGAPDHPQRDRPRDDGAGGGVGPARRLPGRHGIRRGPSAPLGMRRAEGGWPAGAARHVLVRPLPQPRRPRAGHSVGRPSRRPIRRQRPQRLRRSANGVTG